MKAFEAAGFPRISQEQQDLVTALFPTQSGVVWYELELQDCAKLPAKPFGVSLCLDEGVSDPNDWATVWVEPVPVWKHADNGSEDDPGEEVPATYWLGQRVERDRDGDVFHFRYYVVYGEASFAHKVMHLDEAVEEGDHTAVLVYDSHGSLPTAQGDWMRRKVVVDALATVLLLNVPGTLPAMVASHVRMLLAKQFKLQEWINAVAIVGPDEQDFYLLSVAGESWAVTKHALEALGQVLIEDDVPQNVIGYLDVMGLRLPVSYVDVQTTAAAGVLTSAVLFTLEGAVACYELFKWLVKCGDPAMLPANVQHATLRWKPSGHHVYEVQLFAAWPLTMVPDRVGKHLRAAVVLETAGIKLKGPMA